MQTDSRSSRWLIALTASCLAAGPLFAVAPTIKDDAEFFKRDATKRADEGIRAIARKSHRDLLIETYTQPPGEAPEKLKTMTREERNRFYTDWAKRRAEERVVDGIIVIITREPAHLQVQVTDGAGRTFDPKFRGSVEQALLAAFRDKKFDDGLTAAVKLVCEQVGATFPAGGSGSSTPPAKGGGVFDDLEKSDKK